MHRTHTEPLANVTFSLLFNAVLLSLSVSSNIDVEEWENNNIKWNIRVHKLH